MRHIHILHTPGLALCGFNLATAEKPLWTAPENVEGWGHPDDPEGVALCESCKAKYDHARVIENETAARTGGE